MTSLMDFIIDLRMKEGLSIAAFAAKYKLPSQHVKKMESGIIKVVRQHTVDRFAAQGIEFPDYLKYGEGRGVNSKFVGYDTNSHTTETGYRALLLAVLNFDRVTKR